MRQLSDFRKTATPVIERFVSDSLTLANNRSARIGVTPAQHKVAIDVTGFRSFVDVMTPTEADELAELLDEALRVDPHAGKVTVGQLNCPVRPPARETRTVIANHHRSRVRMTRLRLTPPSHFATLVYDMDDSNTQLFRDALHEAARLCR